MERLIERLSEKLHQAGRIQTVETFDILDRELQEGLNDAQAGVEELRSMVQAEQASTRVYSAIQVTPFLAVARAKLSRLEGNFSRAKREVERELNQMRRKTRTRRLKNSFIDPSRDKKRAEIDDFIRNKESLSNSSRMLDDAIQMSKDIIVDMKHQNAMLKATQKTMRNIGNTLGLSKSLIRVITRREFVDKLLVFGGMALTMFALFMLWYYFT